MTQKWLFGKNWNLACRVILSIHTFYVIFKQIWAWHRSRPSYLKFLNLKNKTKQNKKKKKRKEKKKKKRKQANKQKTTKSQNLCLFEYFIYSNRIKEPEKKKAPTADGDSATEPPAKVCMHKKIGWKLECFSSKLLDLCKRQHQKIKKICLKCWNESGTAT